jgi:hypothetical protein
MDMLERAEVPEPRIAEEQTTLAPTGKGIVVRGLMLGMRLALAPRRRKASRLGVASREEEAQASAPAPRSPPGSWPNQVFLADGTPIYTPQQWLVYGRRTSRSSSAVQDIASTAWPGLATEASEKN